MKDSFVFYRDWLNVMEQLPAEIQLELYQAVAQYALNGKTPTLSPMAKIAFGFIQQTLIEMKISIIKQSYQVK